MNSTKNPTQWLTRLLEEAKNFDGAMFPPTDVITDEKVIGVCPEILRPYQAYSRFCEREMKQAGLEMEYASSEADKDALRERMVDMKARQAVLGYIFWSCLNEYLGTFGSQLHLALKQDWKIVERECDHGPESIFRKIFGGQ